MHERTRIQCLDEMSKSGQIKRDTLDAIIKDLEFEIERNAITHELVKSSQILIKAFQDADIKELNYIQWHRFIEAVNSAERVK